jgi:hypothetical protein
LVSLGCEGDAALTGVDPAVNGTNYLVLVYDNGDFTATSDFSSPSNDLCANRLTVGSPGAGGSIDGTLVCAGNEYTIQHVTMKRRFFTLIQLELQNQILIFQ